MNVSECIESLQLILNCMDDKLQGERDKITKLIDLKPSSFEFVLKTAINLLCETQKAEPELRAKWIPIDAAPDTRVAKCSNCGFWQKSNGNDKTGKYQIHKYVYRFCSCCGARMDAE